MVGSIGRGVESLKWMGVSGPVVGTWGCEVQMTSECLKARGRVLAAW